MNRSGAMFQPWLWLWCCFSVPGPPSFLNAINPSLDSLTLEWGPPIQNNGRLAGYTLKYQPGKLTTCLLSSYILCSFCAKDWCASLTSTYFIVCPFPPPSSFSISAVNGTNELGPLKVKDFLANETTFTLDSLNSSMLYKFYLSAKTIKGSGPDITEEAFTVMDTSKLQ